MAGKVYAGKGIAMDKVAIFFSQQLRDKLNKHVKNIILFGSRARGDHKPYSDYDFLVVLDKPDNTKIDIIRNIEIEILNKFDILALSIILSEDQWERKKYFPIGINILKDGKRL